MAGLFTKAGGVPAPGHETRGLVTTGLFFLQDLNMSGGSGSWTQRERVGGRAIMRGKAPDRNKGGASWSNLFGPPLAGTDLRPSLVGLPSREPPGGLEGPR